VTLLTGIHCITLTTQPSAKMVTAVSASYFQRPVSFSYSPEIILTGK
jgi:hypothetical protein